MVSKQINPKLIQALTNEPLANIPTSPTFKHLKGTYVKSIIDQIKKIETPQPRNDMMMKCKQCGHSGKYDVGILCISISNDQDQKPQRQLTGYFRCKHCNSAGPWEDSTELLLLGMSALMAPEADLPVHYGQIQLSDGYVPLYATDGEEHMLNLIAASPTNSLLWNKLGNLYFTGSRPELAMAAFEKSIELDPYQVESHLSIANILMQLKNYKQVIHHLHQMMIAAENYPHLEAKNFRELLSHGICTSFIAATKSKNKYEALPSQQQLIAAGSTVNLQSDKLPRWLSLSSEDITTFYPLAEAFMGKRALELKGSTKKAKPQQKKMSKSDQVLAFIEQQSFFTKADIQNAYPDISASTINRVVTDLRKKDVIQMVQTGLWMKK